MTRSDLDVSTNVNDKTDLAMNLAQYVHANQTRIVAKGQSREPYINHPARVAGSLRSLGVTEPGLISAALLHDVIEDNPQRVIEFFGEVPGSSTVVKDLAVDVLSAHFGSLVSEVVLEVTNPDAALGGNIKSYEAGVRSIKSPEARLIKFFDFADNALNLRELPPKIAERLHGSQNT